MINTFNFNFIYAVSKCISVKDEKGNVYKSEKIIVIK